MAYPRFQRARAHRFVTRYANAGATNDYSTASTTYVAIDATNLTITLEAQVGDVLAVGMAGRWQQLGNEGYVDAVSIVSNAPVNYMSGATSTGDGHQGWFGVNNTAGGTNLAGDLFYTVVAGDLDVDGRVTVRPYWRLSTAVTRIMYCRSVVPIQFSVKNLGPQDPE